VARLLGFALILAVAVAASPLAHTEGRPPEAFTTTVYFLTQDRQSAHGVRRTVLGKSPYALQALRELLAGPTEPEKRVGVASAIPDGVGLIGFRIDGSTRASVELSGLESVRGAVERVRVITQIARTLIGLSGIEGVRLRNEGEPWGLASMDGRVLDRSYDYDYLVGLEVCAPAPGTEAVRGDCFRAVP
jgi:spore germination protein GerM